MCGGGRGGGRLGLGCCVGWGVLVVAQARIEEWIGEYGKGEDVLFVSLSGFMACSVGGNEVFFCLCGKRVSIEIADEKGKGRRFKRDKAETRTLWYSSSRKWMTPT